MGQIGNNSAVGSYIADYQYRTEQARKNDNAEKVKAGGRTIGNPKLSEKAAKYYEKLKAKYSNMDFILVSPEQKEKAESQKGLYQSSKELIVLIDSDKIEQMAEDEAYREKYEGILSNATVKMAQMKSELADKGESVTSVGMTFDDKGNASFFAVVDKSLAMQRERIAENRQERAAEKKEAAKKAEKKENENIPQSAWKDKVMVTASSWEELLAKLEEVISGEGIRDVKTEAEKAVGGSIDYAV